MIVFEPIPLSGGGRVHLVGETRERLSRREAAVRLRGLQPAGGAAGRRLAGRPAGVRAGQYLADVPDCGQRHGQRAQHRPRATAAAR